LSVALRERVRAERVTNGRSHDVKVGENRRRNCDRGGGRRGRRAGGTSDSRLVDNRLISSRLMNSRRSGASRGALSI
jgi:hypothetical protein